MEQGCSTRIMINRGGGRCYQGCMEGGTQWSARNNTVGWQQLSICQWQLQKQVVAWGAERVDRGGECLLAGPKWPRG
jgi:hypothetical protein